MPHNRPLKLRVAGTKDFLVPAVARSGLILMSAVVSTQPLILTLLVLALTGTGWVLYTLGFSKVTDVNLTSVIFPDGSVKLESNGQGKIEGVINGQQWCSSQFAVLRYITGGKRHSMVLLSAHQNADDYRRLLVWLRQDLLLKSE